MKFYNPDTDNKKSDIWQSFNVGSLPLKIDFKPIYDVHGNKLPNHFVLSVTYEIKKKKRITKRTIHGIGIDRESAMKDLIAGLKFNNLTGTLKVIES